MPLVLRRPAAVGFVLTLIACSDAASPNPDHLADVHLIALETFDGSGQAVHPDAALTPLSWGASETELFVTPYPYGDAAKENPSDTCPILTRYSIPKPTSFGFTTGG